MQDITTKYAFIEKQRKHEWYDYLKIQTQVGENFLEIPTLRTLVSIVTSKCNTGNF